MFAQTSEPPYYAVIFTSQRTAGDEGYGHMAERMVAQQTGLFGAERVRGADGLGTTVSYWTSEEAIAAWRNDAEHSLAPEQCRKSWYGQFNVRVARVARVERAYGMAPQGDQP